MGGFPKNTFGSEDEAHRTYSVERNPVGMKMIVEDGRTFRFCENGSADAVSAMLFQSFVPVTDTKGEAVGIIAAGEVDMLEVGATASDQAEDLHNRGYFSVVEAAQLDPIHLILKQNPIKAAGTATVTLESPLVDDIADSETVTYIQNPWRNVIIHPSPPTALVVGVVVRAIPGDEYGWLATSGPAKVLTDNTILIGESVSASLTTDGSMSAWIPDLATTVNNIPTGNIVSVGATTASSVVWLKFID